MADWKFRRRRSLLRTSGSCSYGHMPMPLPRYTAGPGSKAAENLKQNPACLSSISNVSHSRPRPPDTALLLLQEWLNAILKDDNYWDQNAFK